MFYVTCNDISVICVTAQMCRQTEEVVPTVGLPTPDILQGSLTCPSYTDTGLPFLYGDSDTTPLLVAFHDTLGIRRMFSRLQPPASSRGYPIQVNLDHMIIVKVNRYLKHMQNTCLIPLTV